MSFDDIRYVDEWSDNGEHTRGCRQDPHHEGACEPETTMECTAAANIKGEHIPCDIPAPHPGLAHNNRQHEIIWRGAVTEHPTDDGDVPDTDTEQPKGRMFTASEVRRALAGEVPVNWNAAVTGHPTGEPPTTDEQRMVGWEAASHVTSPRPAVFGPAGQVVPQREDDELFCPNFKRHCDMGTRWQKGEPLYKKERRDWLYDQGFKSDQASCDYCNPECPTCNRRERREHAAWIAGRVPVADEEEKPEPRDFHDALVRDERRAGQVVPQQPTDQTRLQAKMLMAMVDSKRCWAVPPEGNPDYTLPVLISVSVAAEICSALPGPVGQDTTGGMSDRAASALADFIVADADARGDTTGGRLVPQREDDEAER